jgi:uncharacterized protein
VAGYFTATGKDEYRKQITNENFSGFPVITIINEIKEDNQVVVEGEVQAKLTNGNPFKVFFIIHIVWKMGK